MARIEGKGEEFVGERVEEEGKIEGRGRGERREIRRAGCD